jgi:hypothetical protein
MCTSSAFRSDFPEFADASVFPESQITFWMGMGQKMLRQEVWDELYTHGLELFTAHHISLARQNARASQSGGAPGLNTGPQSSKSIDRVSVSHDTGMSSLAGKGHWNLTTYGTQFMQLAMMVGMGGVQAYGGGVMDVPALAEWQNGSPRWP